MAQKRKPVKIKSWDVTLLHKQRIYRVFFESMYAEEGKTGAPKPAQVACTVIAHNGEEAIAKAKQAFPGEIVCEVHHDRPYRNFDDDPILL